MFWVHVSYFAVKDNASLVSYNRPELLPYIGYTKMRVKYLDFNIITKPLMFEM